MGLLPFIYLLPALALVAFLDFIKKPAADNVRKRWLPVRFPVTTSAVILVFLLVLVLGGWTIGRDYFREWSHRADLFYESDADLVAVSDYLAGQETAGDTIYLAALHYRHPTVAFLSDRYSEIKWLPESRALVFPADGSALYIYPHNSPLPQWAMDILKPAAIIEGPLGPDGLPAYMVYEWPGGAGLDDLTQGANLIEANFDNTVTLLGYEVGSAAGGESLPLTLYWRVDQLPKTNILPFVHLEDGWGYRWGQVEAFAYPAEQWEPGELIVQQVDIPLQAGIPPGSYRLKVGYFDPDTGRQLARLDEAGRYAGNSLVIDDVIVQSAPPPDSVQQPLIILDQPAVQGLTLAGYERGGQAVAAGEAFPLALWWLADEPLRAMSIQLALVGEDGAGRLLLVTDPVHDSYPFNEWSPPQLVIDRQSLEIPLDFPPGDYSVRVSLVSPEGEELFKLDLGSLTVEETDRLFTVPDIEEPLEARFGDEIQLLGYDLQTIESRQFGLTLFWQALIEPAASYKVFIHVLDLDGVCCIWQNDDFPKQGQYPTDRWLAGEVVVDPYHIELPPGLPAGQYPVEIGLYIPQTGQRLQVIVPGRPANDALFLSPLEIE
jgi:hypothetical protein